jgi:peptidoglycan/LPS O-acetylase OafA/YrhL
MVVLCHASFYVGDGRLVGLKNGVMLFFALSGYLLYRPFVTGRVELRRYAINRAARIMPAYLAALVGVTLLTGDRAFLENPGAYLLFAQNYDETLWQGFLGASWTLVLEVQFYVTLPLIAMAIAGSALRLAVLAAASLLLAAASMQLPGQGDVRLFASIYPAMFWAFAPGMLVAILEHRSSRLGRPWVLVAGIAFLFVGTGSWWASTDVASGLGSFSVVAWAVARQPRLGRLAPLATAGAAITYSMYLWHIDLIRSIGDGPFMVVVLVSLAGVVYLGIERPVMRAARRSSGRQHATVTSVGVGVG